MTDITYINNPPSNNIVTCSTDGLVHIWEPDMFSRPSETICLSSQVDSSSQCIPATCLSFIPENNMEFLVGAEDGKLQRGYRSDYSETKAVQPSNVSYEGHNVFISGIDVMTSNSQNVFLEKNKDFALTSSFDWTVRLWQCSPSRNQHELVPSNDLDEQVIINSCKTFTHKAMVFDVKWCVSEPCCFASVDALGNLNLWDLQKDVEAPVTSDIPDGKPLNKIAWQPEKRNLACGGLNGNVHIYKHLSPNLAN